MFDIFYLSSPLNLFAHERKADSIEHARELSRTRYLWIADAANDYSRFDWIWEPAPWQADQAHVWPSQHQANGGTWLIPKHGYQDVNRDHVPVSRQNLSNRLHIKHNPNSADQGSVSTRYISDYLGTLRRTLAKVDWEYCWVTADVCDYTDFDFSWHPSEWQQHMLHVFASNEQKFGDTFYLHVPTFLEKTQNLKLLEWFETLNFVENISVPRLPVPGVMYLDDSMISPIWNTEFTSPVIHFYRHQAATYIPCINLWQSQTKTVIPLCADNSAALIPRECKNHIRTQVYDYPYIDKLHAASVPSQSQNIVYISYDEPDAEINYQKLTTRFPNTKRIHGVIGMENALKAAARASDTPWFFAVFAKTDVDVNFDFSFLPDYFQEPKHYIFHCQNRVNGLIYGHMGIILYNCNMVITAKEYDLLGLDYTLSFPHVVVPVVSCHGNFDTTAYHTWRTAFRETSKLAYFDSIQPSVENQYRLETWLSKAQGPFAEWCLLGAKDGVEFFQQSRGELAVLKHSFRWQWLRDRFVKIYGEMD